MGQTSTAGVLRLRATSAVSRDQSVRRCAQDDDSVGVLTKNTLNELALWDVSPWDIYEAQEKRNSLVRRSLMVSRSLAAFSNSNFLAASRMSDSSLPM